MREFDLEIVNFPPMAFLIKKIGTICVKKRFGLLTSIGLKVKLMFATAYPERLPKF